MRSPERAFFDGAVAVEDGRLAGTTLAGELERLQSSRCGSIDSSTSSAESVGRGGTSNTWCVGTHNWCSESEASGLSLLLSIFEVGIGECIREPMDKGGEGNEKLEKFIAERASTPECEKWEFESQSETGERALSLETMLDMLREGTCIL